jgi:hypothetical protein
MTITDIKHNHIYICKCNVFNTKDDNIILRVFVRIFNYDISENLVEVHLVGQPQNQLFWTPADNIIEP